MPKVSIIIPSYNHGRFLEKRIQSILEQSFQDFEVIILDDASTDNSREIIEKYRSHPKFVHVEFNEKNTGSPFAQWRKGLLIARNEYIWIAESDDYADPALLATLVALLEAHPRSGLASCYSVLVDDNGQTIGTTLGWWKPEFIAEWGREFVVPGKEFCAYMMGGPPNASAVLFRRKLCLQVGGADPSYRHAGDQLMWAKMLLASDFAHTSSLLNYFRKYSGSVTALRFNTLLGLRECVCVMSIIKKGVVISAKTRDEIACEFAEKWAGLLRQVAVRHGLLEHLAVLKEAFRFDRRIPYWTISRCVWRLEEENPKLAKGLNLLRRIRGTFYLRRNAGSSPFSLKKLLKKRIPNLLRAVKWLAVKVADLWCGIWSSIDAGVLVLRYQISKQIVRRLVRANNKIYVELGAGGIKGVDGWVNIDIVNNCDIIWDLRKGIPFPDGSITKLYSSHFFEHLSYQEGQIFLDECRRTLAPGGTFSICVPNAKLYVLTYLSDDPQLKKQLSGYYKYAFNNTTKIDYLNYIAYMDGQHKYMFDEENLVYIMKAKGFKNVHLRPFDPSLDQKERDFESIYAEGEK